MDFRQIEAFIKVVELESFSKAADELHVSQPSVSNYITTLEKDLGVVLINRSTKIFSVTIAGERFLEKAKEMTTLRHDSIEMLKNLSDDFSGEISILASTVPAQYILPKVLAEFHKRYPGIAFVMNEADTSGVVRGIAAHKADIGFAGGILADKKCDFIEFGDEELVFIAPKNASYRDDKEYTLGELLYSNSYISREYGSGTRIQYEKFFAENGIELDKIKTCACMDSTHGIINAVINGLGVSIVSELAARQMLEHGSLIRVKLKEYLPKRKLYFVLNKKIAHSHLIRRFMEHVAL